MKWNTFSLKIGFFRTENFFGTQIGAIKAKLCIILFAHSLASKLYCNIAQRKIGSKHIL